MEHTIMDRRLSAYLDDELPEAERKRIEAHLEECSRCRQSLQQMRESWDRLGALPQETPAPFFYTRLHHRLHTVKIYKGITDHVLVPFSFACALLFGVFTGSLVGNRTTAAAAVNGTELTLTEGILPESPDEFPESSFAQTYSELAAGITDLQGE